MAVIIENENFGCAVTTWGDHAVVGNPDYFLYSIHSSSYHTGSVQIYKYNNQTDTHELITTLYCPARPDDWLLAAESASVVSGTLHTEDAATSLVVRTKDKDLLVDVGNYLIREDDAYGQSVDLWGDLLAVGCKYFHQTVNIEGISGSTSGSTVDVYNLIKLDPNPYLQSEYVSGFNAKTVGGYYYETASIPPQYDRVNVRFSSTIAVPYDEWAIIDYFTPPPGGGNVIYSIPTTLGAGFLIYECGFNNDVLYASIPNPDNNTSHSFGHKVAINENWLAVSSILHSGSKGAVYLYNKIENFNFSSASADHLSWSYYQVLQPPDLSVDDQFGYDIALNKESGSYSGSLLVGTGKTSNSKVYLYELQNDYTTSSSLGQITSSLSAISASLTGSASGSLFGSWSFNDGATALSSDTIETAVTGTISYESAVYTLVVSKSLAVFDVGTSVETLYSIVETQTTESYKETSSVFLWNHTHTFTPTSGGQYITFYKSKPVYSSSVSNPEDGYGRSVDLWGDVFVIGAPTDRYVYEYSASSLYYNGAVYIYERCPNPSDGFKLMLKSYGDGKILKNNTLGFSVAAYDGKVIAGAPRYSDLTSCFIQGTYSDSALFLDDQYSINGQMLYYQKNTSSLNWDLINTYQTKKKYLYPYTKYGYDVDIHDKFIIVGDPMYLTDTNREINITGTSSFGEPFGVFAGSAWVYNFNNFQSQFYVGNVFYRNGLLVINTSGSAFEDLFLDTRNADYLYTLDYKSKQTMNELQVICQIQPGEFNTSTNPTSIEKSSIDFDINKNGEFDFQDADVLLRYMQYQNTKFSAAPTNAWSQSLGFDDGERSFFQWSADQWLGTPALFSSSFTSINTTLKDTLDFNQDSKIDINDMFILWKYFSYRLNQKNYDNYITPLSRRRLYSDVSDFMDSKSGRMSTPFIKPHFLNYISNVKTDPTGSYLAPFATTVGLYNGLDLVGVAKLANPIKITPDFPYTFVVKMDF